MTLRALCDAAGPAVLASWWDFRLDGTNVANNLCTYAANLDKIRALRTTHYASAEVLEARRDSAEHCFRSSALQCTATARSLIPAGCSAIVRQDALYEDWGGTEVQTPSMGASTDSGTVYSGRHLYKNHFYLSKWAAFGFDEANEETASYKYTAYYNFSGTQPSEASGIEASIGKIGGNWALMVSLLNAAIIRQHVASPSTFRGAFSHMGAQSGGTDTHRPSAPRIRSQSLCS